MKNARNLLAAVLVFAAFPSFAVTGKICIDPRSGGSDLYGDWLTCANNALYLSLKLRDWLNADTNDTAGGGSWTVVMTRTTNVALSLQARADIANNNACNRYMGIGITMQETPASGGATSCKNNTTSVNLRDKVYSRMMWVWPGVPQSRFINDYDECLNRLSMPGEICVVGLYPGVDAAYTGNATKLEEAAIAQMYALQEHYGLAVYKPGNVPTIVVDNTNAAFSASANWSTGTMAADKYGTNYRWRDAQAVSDTANWNPSIATPGWYNIYAWWSVGTNRSARALYILPDGENVYVNQQANGGKWNLLGVKYLSAGNQRTRLSCWVPAGYVVIADAVKYSK